MIIQSIQNRIYELRGERVMLDRDLAALYETETKFLNLAVKRNIKRFPKDFMFQLNKEEFEDLRLQIETLENNDNPLRLQNVTSKTKDNSLRLQNATSKGRGGTRYLPYAFTEQGVAMLSGILNSDKANHEYCYYESLCGNKKNNLSSKRFERTNERNKRTFRRL
jgi:hypothetical protein